ncbi:MAG: DoxX family protein [Candidatus Caenarcaniphilales bacterium]|nr:DoxX family protein [Candidatus Caenarcaniphilales bacterium]
MNKAFINKLFWTDDSLGALILRLTVGTVFTAHGAQKLLGWFDGHGLEATAKFMSSIGLEPGMLMASLAAGTEFFGGLALILGLLTRPAAISLAFTMVVAAVTVHWKGGFFLQNNGYEYCFVLFGASLALLLTGAGRFSVDRVITEKYRA